MAIADRDARGSIFSITFQADHHLDRKCVVFGKLIDGLEVLKKIENVGIEEGKPDVTVKIINCGELPDDKRKINKLKNGKHKNPPKRVGKRRGDIIHQNQTALQIVILSLLSLKVILTPMYLLILKLAHQVMIDGGRGRDLEETGIDVLKERRSDVRKGAKGVIRNQNANQKGHQAVFQKVRADVIVVQRTMM